jgi:hypothetical protein
MSYFKDRGEEKRPAEQKHPEQKSHKQKHPEQKSHKQPPLVVNSDRNGAVNPPMAGFHRIVAHSFPSTNGWVGSDDGEFGRTLMSQMDHFVNDEQGLHRLVDEIPGMTGQLQYVLYKSNIEGLSQMLAEFIQRIGIEEDKDVTPMFERWLESISQNANVEASTITAVTHSIETYAVEKGLFHASTGFLFQTAGQ